jgi:predicted nucleic-acid-binding protein
VNICVDTNVIVRLIVADDEAQQRRSLETIEQAELVTISVSSLCELYWVLDRVYRMDRHDVSHAIRVLLGIGNVVTNRPAVEAGLAISDAGGDFADGVIAYEGHWLGSEMFVSFDKKAVRLLNGRGIAARLLS